MDKTIQYVICGLVVLTVAVGCSTSKTQSVYSINRKGRHQVIIIPFSDAPSAPGSGRMLTHAFYYAFISTAGGRYEVIDTGRVKKELFSRGKSIREPISYSLQDELASQLGADAVITGQVTVWEKGSLATQPVVGFAATCRSVNDSKVLWSLSHTGSEFFWGVEERIPEKAAPRICKKAIDKAIKKGDI